MKKELDMRACGDPLPRKEREDTHWYESRVWKQFKTTGASLNNQWGINRMMELRWCKSGLGKSHLCTFTDREHKVIEDYEKRKKAGKEHGSGYETSDSFMYHIDHDCKKKKCKPYKITTDEYGNKTSMYGPLTATEKKEYDKKTKARKKRIGKARKIVEVAKNK